MATIQDVAVRAGVSTATVSRALNGKSTVHPALVLRVMTAAKELEYEPNGLARSLRRQETAVWGLLVADIENPFYTSVARGVEDVAQAAGYSVVLGNSDQDPQKERDYLKVALQERVAGVILSPTCDRTDVSRLLEHDIGVVTIDRLLPGRPADAVLVGSRSGAHAATGHLLEQAYRRVACVAGPAGDWVTEERLAGYREAISSTASGDASPLVRHGAVTVDGGRVATAELLGLTEPPDALFVTDGLMAAGALEALAERRLRTGRDVGMVAFGDVLWSRLLDPPLTTVRQPAYEVGQEAAQLLLGRLRGMPRRVRTVTLATELVVRGSSSR